MSGSERRGGGSGFGIERVPRDETSTARGRRRRRSCATRRIPLFPDARSSSIKKTRRSSSFPVAPFRVVVAMRALLSVGDAWVDPRDVAGISRGVGAGRADAHGAHLPPRGGLFRRRGRDARRRVDHRVSFASVVALIEARDRILAECHPPGSLWSDPSNANKRLLVLLNPAAGKGRGVEAYERDVAPVLACLTSFRPRSAPASPAGGSGASPPPSPTPSPTGDSRVDVRVTARRGDAQRGASPRLDLDAYAAVVCVGGDGTLAEIFNARAPATGRRLRRRALPHRRDPRRLRKRRRQVTRRTARRTVRSHERRARGRRGALHAVDCAEITVVADRSAGAPCAPSSPSPGAFSRTSTSSPNGFDGSAVSDSPYRRRVVRILFMRRYRATSRRTPTSGGDVRGARRIRVRVPNDSPRRTPGLRRASRRRGGAFGRHRGRGHGVSSGMARNHGRRAGRVGVVSSVGVVRVMFAAPAAEASDGAYDVLIVSGASKLALLGLLLVFDAGGHVNHPAVTYVKASAFEISPGTSDDGGGGYVAVDGELVATARRDEGTRRGGGTGTGDVAHAVRRDQGGGDGGRGDGVRGGRGGGRRRRERRVRRSRGDERRAVVYRESEKCLHLVKLSHKTPACAVIRPRLS